MAKGLGNEIARPTRLFEVDAFMGSLVGMPGCNVRHALPDVDSMSSAF